MAYTSLPNSAVCYLLADFPGVGEFQATGVIIGPHTILTASHELWDADIGKSADQVSVYPGYVPNGSDYNPSGALGGTQAIHDIKIADQGGELDQKGTEHDFAVIDTSANLSSYGQFALNLGFKTGDTDLIGYPASSGGNQEGSGTVLSANALYSDLDTGGLTISPGDSGGPIFDQVPNGRGGVVPAVTGIVSTGGYASKITRRKLGIIGNWVTSDASLWTGQGSPGGIVTPQIPGTVDAATLASNLSPPPNAPPTNATQNAPLGDFATMVDVLHRTRSSGGEASLASSPTDSLAGLAAPHRDGALRYHHDGGVFSV